MTWLLRPGVKREAACAHRVLANEDPSVAAKFSLRAGSVRDTSERTEKDDF